MDLSRFEMFIKTAQLGNVTKAAEQLGYTQSAASHSIACLENEFGFPLFIRCKSGMVLTETGKRMYSVVFEAVQKYRAVFGTAEEINGLSQGALRIGTFTSVASQWMPEIMIGFSKQYPHIDIGIADGNYDDVEKWISEGYVDCGFVVQPTRQDFELVPLTEENMLAVLPAGHALCCYQEIPLKTLKTEHFIVPAEGTAYNVGRIMRDAEIEVSRSTGFVSDLSVISMVRARLGISVLPELILKGIVLDGIETRRLAPSVTRTICTAVTRTESATPACRRFLQYVQEWSASRQMQ